MDQTPAAPIPPLSALTSKPVLDSRSIQVITLLVWLYPLGVLLMWLWLHDWPRSLKWSVTLPLILAIVSFALSIPLSAYVFSELSSSMQSQRPSSLLRDYEDITNP